jgi:hypothetical protein
LSNFVTDNPALPVFVNARSPAGRVGELDASHINDLWSAANDLRTQVGGFANVVAYGADPTGTIPSDTAFANALVAASYVLVPAGSYSLVSGVTIPSGKSIIGLGAQSSVLNYSGSSAAITLNGCQGSRVENLKIVTTNTGAGVRGLWMRNAGGSSQYNRVVNNLFIQFSATGRAAGQVGLLIEDDAATTLSQFWHHIENNRFLSWETSIRLLQSGIGADGVNQSFFYNNVCIANIIGLQIGKGCGDHVVTGLYGSHSSVATFTDTVLVIGDAGGASPNSGNNICTGIVSDMGANGKAFEIKANSVNNYVIANNESSLADIDSGTNSFCLSTKNLSGTNSRFRLPNLTILSSGSSFSGTILGGKVQQTQHRAGGANPNTYSTSDRIVAHTGLTAAITDTLPASFSGGEYIVKDEDGSASAVKTVSITCQAGETIDNVTSKVIINSPGGVARIYGIGSGLWFTW